MTVRNNDIAAHPSGGATGTWMGRHQAISLFSSSAKAYSWEGGESKSMSTPTWEFQYSIEADAHPEFAWEFWTNIANWRELEPGVEFELDG